MLCQANYCKQECLNGYCHKDGQCKCPHGYTKALIPADTFLCEKLTVHTGKLLSLVLGLVVFVSLVLLLVVKALTPKASPKLAKNEKDYFDG